MQHGWPCLKTVINVKSTLKYAIKSSMIKYVLIDEKDNLLLRKDQDTKDKSVRNPPQRKRLLAGDHTCSQSRSCTRPLKVPSPQAEALEVLLNSPSHILWLSFENPFLSVLKQCRDTFEGLPVGHIEDHRNTCPAPNLKRDWPFTP